MKTSKMAILRLWKAAKLVGDMETLVRAARCILQSAGQSNDDSIVIDFSIFEPEEICFLYEILPQWNLKIKKVNWRPYDDACLLKKMVFGEVTQVAAKDPMGLGFIPVKAALAALENEK